MSTNWDFFFREIAGRTASIFVDLDADLAAREALPLISRVTVEMRVPRTDGLSSQDEYDALVAIEDLLERDLAADDDVLYIGRITHQGRRDFHFYSNAAFAWEERVREAMSNFPGYKFEAARTPDPEWAVYLTSLMPTDVEKEHIENRRVCNALKENGDDLDSPREIDHWAVFSDAASRDEFVRRAGDLGFALRASGEDRAQFSAQVFRMDTPDPNAIDDVCMPLFLLSRDLGGRYDGWECQVTSKQG